jgi:molybdopterin-dependent oxidoreductase alpha subunit
MDDRHLDYPLEKPPLEVSAPKTVAGGWPAITSTLHHTLEEAGLMRGVPALLAVNQKGGFDCASCAWPDPDGHRSVAEFCENGAKAVAEEATTQRVEAGFFRDRSLARLSEQTDHWLGKQGRLTEPMVRRKGSEHYEPIGWDEAFALIGRELQALDSPDEVIFYTSGRTSNEAAFLYQLVARLFGTNNLPDCSNMCHESSGVALTETIGIGKGTVTLRDFAEADAIFILGQNPGTNHPRMLTALQEAAERGCRLVSINPLPEAGLMAFQHPQHPLQILGARTELATLHLPVRINGDVAFLKGLMKELLAAERAQPGTVFDHVFLEAHTSGYDELIADLDAVSWDAILDGCGVTRD